MSFIQPCPHCGKPLEAIPSRQHLANQVPFRPFSISVFCSCSSVYSFVAHFQMLEKGNFRLIEITDGNAWRRGPKPDIQPSAAPRAKDEDESENDFFVSAETIVQSSMLREAKPKPKPAQQPVAKSLF